jgi:hypothetical protein
MDLKRIGNLLAASAAVVTGVLALFGAVLRSLVPPSQGLSPDLFAGLASLAILILLLILVLSLPTRPTRVQRLRLASLCGVSGVLAVACLVGYVALSNEYVFTYAEEGEPEQRHLRGELTPTGRQMTQDMTLSAAIRKLGGLEMAQSHQFLWTEQSRKAVELQLLIWYVVSAAMLSTTVFSLAITLIASKRAG